MTAGFGWTASGRWASQDSGLRPVVRAQRPSMGDFPREDANPEASHPKSHHDANRPRDSHGGDKSALIDPSLQGRMELLEVKADSHWQVSLQNQAAILKLLADILCRLDSMKGQSIRTGFQNNSASASPVQAEAYRSTTRQCGDFTSECSLSRKPSAFEERDEPLPTEFFFEGLKGNSATSTAVASTPPSLRPHAKDDNGETQPPHPYLPLKWTVNGACNGTASEREESGAPAEPGTTGMQGGTETTAQSAAMALEEFSRVPSKPSCLGPEVAPGSGLPNDGFYPYEPPLFETALGGAHTSAQSWSERTQVSKASRRQGPSLLKRLTAYSSGSLALFANRRRSQWAQKVYSFLDDPESSRAAWLFSTCWDPFIFIAVVLSIVGTTQEGSYSSYPFEGVIYFQAAVDVLFLLECGVRYSVCPNNSLFFRSFYNMADLVAAMLPLCLRIANIAVSLQFTDGTMSHYLIFCIAPTVRLLKVLRRFQQFHLFIHTFSETKEALGVLVFLLSIIVLIFSSAIYAAEPRDNIPSMPSAMWLTIVTMTTVGYGDKTPDTTIGHCVVSTLVLCSMMYTAMPIGIIGNAFTAVWQDRHRILLVMRMRDRLENNGYQACDFPSLFRHFNAKGDGELNLGEFMEMMKEMRIGLKPDRIVELFESLDKDGGGGIDDREFVRALFPSEFHQLYMPEDGSASDKEKESESKRTSVKAGVQEALNWSAQAIQRISSKDRGSSKERASSKDRTSSKEEETSNDVRQTTP